MPGEGYDSYYEHHAPSLFSYWGVLGYDTSTTTYFPRKNFYAIQHVSGFVPPGSRRVAVTATADSLNVTAFRDSVTGKTIIIGINQRKRGILLSCKLLNLSVAKQYELYYTNSDENLRRLSAIKVAGKTIKCQLPADCIFTIAERKSKND